MIGKLVRYKQGDDTKREYWGVGIVLDWRHTGRFYPSIQLTVQFSKQDNIILFADIKSVEFLDESR